MGKDLLKGIIKPRSWDNIENDKVTVIKRAELNFVPKISIIIPVYNAEKYLTECLDSVINQTFKEIEIICIDDGSKDSSLEILKEYAEKDNRITVLTQENSGPASARNTGLFSANGEYLMFCDNDDTYEPIMCSEMYNTIDNSDFDFVMCDANVIETEANHGRSQTVINYHKLKYKGEFILTAWQKYKTNVLLWNKIYKMSLIKKYNIYFPEGIKCEDNAFTWLYLSYSKKMHALDKELYNYKLLANSVMGSIYNKKHFTGVYDRIYALRFTINNLIKYSALGNNKWLFKVAEDGIYLTNSLFPEEINLNFLKKLNKYILWDFSKEQLEDFPLLIYCYNKKYRKIIRKHCKHKNNKKCWFGTEEKNNKKKFYLFGVPLFKIKKGLDYKKYYFLGIQIRTKKQNASQLVMTKLNQLEGKIANYYLKQRLFTKLDIPEEKRYITCFDCLYDKGQECVDTYTFFKYLQKNNIPSKYIVLKDSKLGQEIAKDKDVIAVADKYQFLYGYTHIIQSSKVVLTSFGLYSGLDSILQAVPYFDYIFFEHGTILLKKWVLEIYSQKNFNKILVPSRLTRELYLKEGFWDENQMVLSGLPRWDNLQKTRGIKNNKSIFVFFTWRTTFSVDPRLAVKYMKKIVSFIKELKRNINPDIKINLAWHHELESKKVALPKDIANMVTLIRTDKISEAIKNSDMLVTDFSSVWSDFMYQNKPVVFYRFDKDELYLNEKDQNVCIEAMQQDSKLYNCVYDQDKVIEKINYYIENDFRLEPHFKEINKQIFWDNKNNCEEICKQIMQTK